MMRLNYWLQPDSQARGARFARPVAPAPLEGPATSTEQEDEKQLKTSGLAAAVQHTISLLKVSHIETGAPTSPGTNYGKIFKS